MSRTVKIGGALVFGVFVLALLTLRLVGYEPQYLYPSGEEFARNNRIARPGLWLTGEVVREVITDWDFVNHLDDPERRDTVMLETRTWYGIPHSVTIGIVGRGGKLYIHARSGSRRMADTLPERQVLDPERVPRPARTPEDRGRDLRGDRRADDGPRRGRGCDGTRADNRRAGPDGQERVTAVMHYWRVFQRNVPDYSADSQGVAF